MPEGVVQRPMWVDELLDYALQEATGRFLLVGHAGDHQWVWLRDGLLSGVSAAARRPLIANRLIAFQILAPEVVAKALESVRLQPGGRLLDVLINERLVPQDFIYHYVRSTMAEQLATIVDSDLNHASFEPGLTQRLSPILMSAQEIVGMSLAAPRTLPPMFADSALLATGAGSGDSAPLELSFLRACDGQRRADEVGDQCGLTLAETMHIVHRLSDRAMIEQVPLPRQLPSWEATHLAPGQSYLHPSSPVDDFGHLFSGGGMPELPPGPDRGPAQAQPQQSEPRYVPEPVAPMPSAPAPQPAPPAPRPVREPVAQQSPMPAPQQRERVEVVPPMPNPVYHPQPRPEAPARELPPELSTLVSALAAEPPAPEPVDQDAQSVDVAPEARRDVMSLLASFGTLDEPARPAPEPPAPVAPEPDTRVETVWLSRVSRPADAMSSSDVFRELHSLEALTTEEGSHWSSDESGGGGGKKKGKFGR